MLLFPWESLLMLYMSTGVYHPMVLLTELQRKCECLNLCISLWYVHQTLQCTFFIYSFDKHHFNSWASASSSSFFFFTRLWSHSATVPASEKQNSIIPIITNVRLHANLLKSPSPIQWRIPTPAPLSFCLLCRDKEDLSCCCDLSCFVELGQRMRTLFPWY